MSVRFRSSIATSACTVVYRRRQDILRPGNYIRHQWRVLFAGLVALLTISPKAVFSLSAPFLVQLLIRSATDIAILVYRRVAR